MVLRNISCLQIFAPVRVEIHSLKAAPEVTGIAACGEVVSDVDAVALPVGRHLAADVAHVVAVELGLRRKCNAAFATIFESYNFSLYYVLS